MEHASQVQSAQKEHAEHPGDRHCLDQVRAGHVARAEHAQRHERARRGRLTGDERSQEDDRAGAGEQRLRDDPVHAEHHRTGDQDGARDVRPVLESEPRLRREQPQRDGARDDPDRDVDEEDPVPVDRLRQHAPDEQPDRATRGRYERVRADRLRLLTRLGEHPHDHPEHDGGGQRAAGALDEPRSDQRRLAVGQAACRARRREHGQADQEDPPVPEQVAETAGQQQQAAERDQVAVHDPREGRLREVQVDAGSRAGRRSRSWRRARSSASPCRGSAGRSSGCPWSWPASFAPRLVNQASNEPA